MYYLQSDNCYHYQTPSRSSWTETAKTETNTADAGTVLNNFVNWINANSNTIPNRDHAMLFTRYDIFVVLKVSFI